ncbi:MAG: cyclic pyranopterin monophosphate synthase MoaC [Chloroflexi bacterium]|nr:cyclic pyranopterin monophosphate synthase MoaC [Chloroflexota bacterium]
MGHIRIYTDGACQGNPGPGGWAAVLLDDSRKTVLQGHEERTTSNRMELLAAIQGLEHTPEGSHATVYSDSQYLVFTMTRGWKRNKNLDLWQRLDELVKKREVHWDWIEGHAGHPENEEANRLAQAQTGMSGVPSAKSEQAPPVARPAGVGPSLTHVDEQGRARMVDIGGKPETAREAVAKGRVLMERSTLELVKRGLIEKGDVLSVARTAGIMAAKRTHDLVPLCHPLLLTHVSVDLQPNDQAGAIDISATVRTTGKTGVEMEALTAVSVAALTVYDMCKAADKGMRITEVRLVRKTGGKSGTYVRE